MNRLDYLDFDLLFEKSGEEYSARVLNSPAGQAVARFRLPFNSFEIENLLLRVGRTRRGVRRLESPEMEASRSFGSRLFSAVFNDEMLSCLRSSLNESYRQGTGLRLRLRFTAAPELGDLPWEFLYDPTRNQFLVLSVETPLVRYLEIPQDIQPLPVSPPLQVLVMIASPQDYPTLDVEREWLKLKEALGDLEERGLVSLTRLEKATLANLQRQLRRDRYHIFHFIGHGAFDRQAQDGMLLAEDEAGRGRMVSGYDLGTLLHDHRSLRLAVLNACEGARSSLSDPFAGVAQSLVQKGLPAVIAMQFEITDPAAITLAHEFYGALADSLPVDAALAEARKAIFAQGNDVEWATPVLYLRIPSAAIFHIDAPAAQLSLRGETARPQAVEIKAEAERLYTQGLSAYWLDEWEQASESFEAVLRLQPDHAEAASRLEAARRKLRLERLSQQAQAAEQTGDWEAAIAPLEELSGQAPEYKEAAARLETARKHNQVEDLYAEARQLSLAANWKAVGKLFDHIHSIDPSAPDPDGLLPAARKKLDDQERQAELEALYNRAILALDAGQLENAIQMFKEIEAKQPGYRQAGQLLRRAEADLARLARPDPPQAVEQAAAIPSKGQAEASLPGQPISQPPGATPQDVSRKERRLELPAVPDMQETASRLLPALRSGILLGAGWFLATLLAHMFMTSDTGYGLIEPVKIAINYALDMDQVEYLLTVLFEGLLSGAAVAIVLWFGKIRLTRLQILLLIISWSAAYSLTLFFNFGEYSLSRILMGWSLAGMLGGLATGMILHRAASGFDWKAVALSILGWAAGMGLGEWLIQAIYWGWISESLALSEEFMWRVSRPLFFGFAHGVEGLIGGLVLFALIMSVTKKEKVTPVS